MRPGKLAFHLLSLLAVLTCLVAARWQWHRAHRGELEAIPATPLPISQFDATSGYSGLRLELRGRFDPDSQILIAPRARDGQAGAWVFTALIPDATAADPQPAAWGVIRGWIPQGETTPTPPSGEVEVVGVLIADERSAHPAFTAADPPTMTSIDSGALATVAGYPVRAGWLALDSPESPGQPTPLRVGELPGAQVGLNWRNAGYALQWLVFAGFAMYFWNRFRIDYFGATPERVGARGEGNE